MTNDEQEAGFSLVASELRELSENLFEAMGRLRDPIPGSELADLAGLHQGAVLNVADSVASAMDAVSCSAHTLAYLLDQQDSPAYEPTHAGLIRQMLIGSFTAAYILGPNSIETREERARNLVAAEYHSAIRAARTVKASKGPDFNQLRTDAEGWEADILADRKKYGIAASADDKTGMITAKGSEEFVKLLVGALRDRDDITDQERDRLLANVPDTTRWAWEITSGFAHAYHWPYLVTQVEDVPRLLNQLVEAIRISSMLCIFSALTSRDLFHEFHSLMLGTKNTPPGETDLEV